MLQKITIKNFRCFEDFELQQLGRINLLVGKNNSGKTSVLEAIKLLHSGTDINSLKELMINRGEFISNDSRLEERQFNLNYLFSQYKMSQGSKFSILGQDINQNDILKLFVEYNLIPLNIYPVKKDLDRNSEFENFQEELGFIFNWTYDRKNHKRIYGILSDILMRDKVLPNKIKLLTINETELTLKAKFITSASLTTNDAIELFNQVVLTPEEDFVYQALQIIEPKLIRIAPMGSETSINGNFRGGFFVLLSDTNQRIPIGSMGDGIWRILGLTLALISAKDGVLLVDEIDTGLHYSTLEDMWKLIWETAKKLNVQVFATTHNSDCWTSLASLANREDVEQEGISIQRIEKGKNKSVVFTSSEIAVAAERGIEVR